MTNQIEIRPVSSKQDMDAFIQVAWDLHANDANWVPPLRIAVKDTLDTKKNPFFKHAKMQLWVAYKGDKRVGRMGGFIDDTHNKFHEEKTGFWGFFECVGDEEVSKKLFETVEAWGKRNGMDTMRGPMNPSTNHECGMQISAFDTKPFVMMTQNPAYYPELVEKSGYTKAKDLYAWLLDNSKPFNDKLIKRAKDLEKSAEITFRHVDMKKFDEEIEMILQIYNDAWEKNWGFVPMTPEEFRHMAKDLKQIVVPELLFIVEVKGEPAGFSLWLPDVNQIFVKIRDGKLFPTGLIKLLWNMKVNKKSINQGRILTLGIRRRFQPLGLAPLMYMRYFEKAPAMGYPVGECSWVLEDNKPMSMGLQYMGANHYKTYRIYDKKLN